VIFRKKENISVTVKLHTGLHRELNLDDYNPADGVVLTIPGPCRVRRVVKSLGLRDPARCAYFINGERAGLFTRVKNGDEISCFKPSAGG